MNDKCGYHLYRRFHQKLYLPPVETVPMSVWVRFLQVQVWEIPILYHFNHKFDHKFSCGYPELNLFAKLSWSQVAHEHVTKEGTYLLLLNVILILIFLPSACLLCNALRCHFSTSKQYLDTRL